MRVLGRTRADGTDDHVVALHGLFDAGSIQDVTCHGAAVCRAGRIARHDCDLVPAAASLVKDSLSDGAGGAE